MWDRYLVWKMTVLDSIAMHRHSPRWLRLTVTTLYVTTQGDRRPTKMRANQGPAFFLGIHAKFNSSAPRTWWRECWTKLWVCSQANKTIQEQAPRNIYVNSTERYHHSAEPSHKSGIFTQEAVIKVWIALTLYISDGLYPCIPYRTAHATDRCS